MDTLDQAAMAFGAEGALARVREAESIEGARKAVAELLSRLADEFRESAHECERNWQDKAAGKPWTKLARQLERYVEMIDR